MSDHKYFIVIIIFYISKNHNYKLSCKSDLMVTYRFGCSTCNSWPFFFKIVANEAYLQGLHRFNSVLLVFYWFSFSWNGQTAAESPVFSSPVWSQSGFFLVLWTRLLIPTYLLCHKYRTFKTSWTKAKFLLALNYLWMISVKMDVVWKRNGWETEH